MRRIVIGAILLALVTYGVYAASMSGSAKTLGGGSDSVPHCKALNYSIPASNTISSLTAQVKCDITGSYTVEASVTSGASSGSGQTAASLTANVAQDVVVNISPSVAISGSAYSADIRVKR